MAKNRKTTAAGPGRVSRGFWRLLGASTDKTRAESMSEVEAAAEFDQKAADLDDEQLKKTLEDFGKAETTESAPKAA